MAELDTPFKIIFDYVVEVVNSNTGATTEEYHYEKYDRALEKYEKLKEKDTLVLLALYTEVHRIMEQNSIHKLVLARNV